MKNYILEGCVDSFESAKAAVKGGANRLELCANLVIGGTTPSACLFKQVQKEVNVPINVLIRPRFGDFLYSENEFEEMAEEIREFKRLGANAVVIGALNADGSLDKPHLKALRKEAEGMHLTLHRAFDMSSDPMQALEDAIEIGFDTILTSGCKNNAIDGKELFEKLVPAAKGRIDILVAGEENPENILYLAKHAGARCFHMAGKTTLQSEMKYRREGVNMGIPGFSEYEIYRSNEEIFKNAVKVLEEI